MITTTSASSYFHMEDSKGNYGHVYAYGTYVTEEETGAGWWSEFRHNVLEHDDGFVVNEDELKERLGNLL